jgi:hypothetical protein
MLARTSKNMTEEGLLTRARCTETFPPQVFYSLKQDALEFLQLAEPAIAWAGEHAELIAQAQAYSRQRGRDVGMLTGIAELDESTVDDEDDDQPILTPARLTRHNPHAPGDHVGHSPGHGTVTPATGG